MDIAILEQVFKLLANNGLAIFLVIYYVIKQSKRDDMLISGFSQMTNTFTSLNETLKEKLK